MPWILRLALPLMAFWLILSGHYTPLFIGLGVFSVALVCWVAWRADVIDDEGIPVHLLLGLPRYLTWLGKEVLVSAVTVARQVWNPRLTLRPTMDTVSSKDMSELSQVVYANSITLTPGTLSLAVDDDGIEVHSLAPEGITELHAGGMRRRVQRLEARE